MTIHIDWAVVLSTIISSAVSILATWYFSRRYYTRRTLGPPPTTADIEMEKVKNEHHLLVWLIIAGLLALVILLASGTYCVTAGW